jgi:hypothetical protein
MGNYHTRAIDAEADTAASGMSTVRTMRPVISAKAVVRMTGPGSNIQRSKN